MNTTEIVQSIDRRLQDAHAQIERLQGAKLALLNASKPDSRRRAGARHDNLASPRSSRPVSCSSSWQTTPGRPRPAWPSSPRPIATRCSACCEMPRLTVGSSARASVEAPVGISIPTKTRSRSGRPSLRPTAANRAPGPLSATPAPPSSIGQCPSVADGATKAWLPLRPSAKQEHQCVAAELDARRACRFVEAAVSDG